MVPEAPLEQTDAGLVAKGDGWFVLNAKDSRWYHADGRSGLLRPRGRRRVLAAGDQHLRARAGPADGDVSLGGRPGGLPRGVGRSDPDRGGRGASAARVGLRPLPARHEARHRRRRRRALRRSSPSALATSRSTTPTGAGTPSTRSPCATVPAWRRRRRSPAGIRRPHPPPADGLPPGVARRRTDGTK